VAEGHRERHAHLVNGTVLAWTRAGRCSRMKKVGTMTMPTWRAGLLLCWSATGLA
jgi:hypothetical protein